MTKLVFVAPDGARREVEAKDGDSVMQVALANSVDEIKAECGGALACATCHVYVDDAWADKVGTADDIEQDMLDFAAAEVRETSRLSCQIKISDTLNGLVVHLPESQD